MLGKRSKLEMPRKPIRFEEEVGYIREELEHPETLRSFLIETWDALRPDNYREVDEPSLENYRQLFKRYKILYRLNPHFDLIHQVTEEGFHFNATGPNSVRIQASDIHQFNGQGIYFGLGEPFGWISTSVESNAYRVPNISIRDIYASVSGNARSLMAVLPLRQLVGTMRQDGASTISGQQRHYEDLLHVHDDENSDLWKKSSSRQVYYTVEADNLHSSSDALWYKMDDDYCGPLNKPDISARSRQFIHESLGLIGVERVTNDPEIPYPFDRAYVRETNPLLCGVVADATMITEMVYGGSDTAGGAMIQDFIKRQRSK